MPTYQYRCTECGHDLEVVQKFSDPSLTECPSCHGQLRKVFNAVGVVFKGSGFYRTDSRAKEGSTSNGASSGGASKDSAGTGASEKKGSGDSGSSSTSGSTTSDSGAKPAKAASSTGGPSSG